MSVRDFRFVAFLAGICLAAWFAALAWNLQWTCASRATSAMRCIWP